MCQWSSDRLSKKEEKQISKTVRVYPEKQDRDHREATAIRITRLIIEIDMDKGLPNLGFNAYVFDRIKEHVHLRFKKCSQQDFSQKGGSPVTLLTGMVRFML